MDPVTLVCLIVTESVLTVQCCWFSGLLTASVVSKGKRCAVTMLAMILFLMLNVMVYLSGSTISMNAVGTLIVECATVILILSISHPIYLYAVHFPCSTHSTMFQARTWLSLFQFTHWTMTTLCVFAYLLTVISGNWLWVHIFFVLLEVEVAVLSLLFPVFQDKARRFMLEFGGIANWQSLSKRSRPNIFRKWSFCIGVVSILEFAFS